MGVAFEERNVIEDEEALAVLERLQVFSTPVTLVGEEPVVGFNRKRLSQLLGLPETG
ncbi:MAG: hypothetical protein K1X65_15485 [Caldilineales bacterium]|nr:hypothetical protein [Caldilineales bacterium]MCW5857641.1 hypothetical protein [Caldilineales bacterium]